MRDKVDGPARAGITFGCALAITVSWSIHKSLLWAIIHGLLGWLYIIAYALGFEHPQSFSKLFKSKTNQTPLGFRASFN